MLTTADMKESKENYVYITDFDFKTMEQLLRFIYCCEFDNLDEIASLPKNIKLRNYKNCIDHIVQSLPTDKEKVLDALFVADRISDLDNLFKECVKRVVKNYKELSQSPKWKQLSKEMTANINYVKIT